ncbi:hypothetical protein M422DRAFT_192574 [Sphaerobolus stellatus SS14]|uniref:4-coumarate--CoA ligase n=1 Tax=Sphaerobolus stellatus (strain SS14) TaxID=990650 RepID=A0A0C9UAR2_SPHS4|nr:hypothetical protein M422DRAFT_192574 [Sphaerobolus stellatus SS14]
MYIRSPFPPLPPLPDTNCYNFLFRTPDRLALEDYVMYIDAVTGRKVTRYQFIERIYDCMTALGTSQDKGGLGLGNDCVVGILSDNCIDYCTLIHALLGLTAPFALFSSYATPHELKHFLNRSKSTHMFVHADLLEKFLSVAREEDFPFENIFVLDGKVTSGLKFRSLDNMITEVRRNQLPKEPVRAAGKDTLAYLVFSSGTSGLPKAVMISHGNLIASMFQTMIMMMEVAKVKPPPPDFHPVTLGFLPIYHSYGLHGLCLRPPLRPSTIVIFPRWDLDLVLSSIPKYRITTLLAIPSVIHTLLSSPKFANTDLSSVVAILSGAAYLPPSLQRKIGNVVKTASLSEGYGMSEATLSVVGNLPTEGLMKGILHVSSNIGILFPGVEAVILRPDGTHCLPDEPGDLYVKGTNVALGYWNDSEATKSTFIANGWLKTGDRFRVTSKGMFYFEDREKDTLKVSGLQVSPAEIETTILAEPSNIISDVAVSGVQLPTARTSDDKAPRAWIVLTEKGKKLSEDQAKTIVADWVKKCLSKYKWLRGGVEIVDEIPKNPTGKSHNTGTLRAFIF